jgi:hypothetical protein
MKLPKRWGLFAGHDRQHGAGENGWLTNESDKYIRDHIGNMTAYSKMIKSGCEKHGLSYFGYF